MVQKKYSLFYVRESTSDQLLQGPEREVNCYGKNQRHSYETHLVPIRESCPKVKSIIMLRKEVDLDVNPILVPSAVFSLEYFHSNLS